MTKAKPTKNKNPSPAKKPGSTFLTRLGIAVAVIFAATLLFTAYQNYQKAQEQQAIQQERERFLQVERDVQALAKQLNQANIGGAQWTVESYCSQGRAKFVEGDITCRAIAKASVQQESLSHAQEYIDKVELQISSAAFRKTHKLVYNPEDFLQESRAGFVGAEYSSTNTGIGCGSLYEIAAEEDHVLTMLFDCGDPARKFYFKSKD